MQLNMVGSRGMPLGEAEHRRVHFRKDAWEAADPLFHEDRVVRALSICVFLLASFITDRHTG